MMIKMMIIMMILIIVVMMAMIRTSICLTITTLLLGIGKSMQK